MTVVATGASDLPPLAGEDYRVAYETSPCGLATMRLADAVVVAVNDTLLGWLGRTRSETVGLTPLTDLLVVGARIYWETHLFPLLSVEGRLEEVALELRTPEGRLPVLVSGQVFDRTPTDPGVVRLALVGSQERQRYERETLAARRRAEASEGRARVLARATTALVEADGSSEIGQVLLDQLGAALGVTAATVWSRESDGDLRPLASRGEVARPLPSARELDAAGHRHAGRRLVPLPAPGGPQGWLSFAPRDDDGTSAALEMVGALCQQAGLALQRAEYLEQQETVAHVLQRSLLATSVPLDSRFRVATVYRPGVETLEVGGDWHDTFLVAEGLLGIVVGDVVGRGLTAASAMGQLRSAVRAIAAPDVGPAALLERLDSFVEQVEAAAMATLAYAQLDLETGELRYACAGHPPPLLLPAQGEARLLWDGRSTPLGAFGAPSRRDEASIVLAPGDRLLLCTDGLVERRDRNLDEGFELLRAAAEQDRGGLTETVEAVTAGLLRDERHRDDVCVLLLGWSGGEFSDSLGADLQQLPELRSRLRAWLVSSGVGSDCLDDLVLAVSEALANAAEHGHDLDGSVDVDVRAVLRGGEVVLEIRDRGVWLAQTTSEERGRGTMIMQALVDEVTCETGDGTLVRLRKRLGGWR